MSTNRHIRLLALTGFILPVCLLLTSTGCTPRPATETAAQRKPIRVAFNTWIGYSSFYIAEEKGIFNRLGLKVETKVIDPLAEKNAALLRGDLDAMGGTIDSTIVTATSGVQGKVVYMFDRSKGTDGILVSDKVKTVDDLKKIRVAVEEGFVGHFFLLYYLEKNGISHDAVSIIPMTTDAAGAAFAAGKVEAAVTWEPYLTTALKRPNSRVLVSSAELEPILADTLFVSQNILQQRSNDIASLVQALQEANDYWLANPKEINALVARRWKMSEDEVAGIMKTDQLYTVADQRAQFGQKDTDGDLYRYLSKAAELWLNAGVVKQKVDPARLLDGFAVRKLKGYSAK
jgi:NitT/TauT family transport system substrate-binding protein